MLGDAIHNVHPITGQGMNLAIEDASALADALDLALRDACALGMPWPATRPSASR